MIPLASGTRVWLATAAGGRLAAAGLATALSRLSTHRVSVVVERVLGNPEP